MKWLLIPLAFILAACGGQPNAPTAPGQNGTYQAGIGINQRLEVYRISGHVLGMGNSIQRPEMQGGATYVNGYGSAYVSSSTPGKGFVRFHADEVTWTMETTQTAEFEPVVKAGDDVLLKTSDTKAASLLAGDVVTFLCRAQAEFVEAVAGNEQPAQNKIVMELDYCRLEKPQFTPGK